MDNEDRKIDLTKHALGWPKCYRNYFAAGAKDSVTCLSLVSTGHMVLANCSWSGGPVYQVTPEGRKACKEGGL